MQSAGQRHPQQRVAAQSIARGQETDQSQRHRLIGAADRLIECRLVRRIDHVDSFSQIFRRLGDQRAERAPGVGIACQYLQSPVAIHLRPQRFQRRQQSFRIERGILAQQQAEPGTMPKDVQHLLRYIGFHLGHAPTDGRAIGEFLGLADHDGEAMLQHVPAARADGELHDVFAVAQAARRAVEREPAAQRVHPVGEGRADILSCEAIMRIAKPLIVEQHLDAGNARARERPSFDGQPSGDRLDHRAGNHRGRIDLQAEFRRGWGRWRALDQDRADFVPRVVEAIAQHHADAVFAVRHMAK